MRKCNEEVNQLGCERATRTMENNEAGWVRLGQRKNRTQFKIQWSSKGVLSRQHVSKDIQEVRERAM